MKNKEEIKKILYSRGYTTVFKALNNVLEVNEALLFGMLISKDSYWDSRDNKRTDYFYDTIEGTKKDTGLSGFQSRKAIKGLMEKELIFHYTGGIPRKRYFKINYIKLNELL